MKRIVLFDIDHTLIDTDKLYQFLVQNLITAVGTEKDAFTIVHGQYFSTLQNPNDFHSDTYLKHIGKYVKTDLNFLKKVFYSNLTPYKKSVFGDAISSLAKLSKIATLGIFSEGFVKFQTIKLANSGLIDFFDKDHLYILRRKLANNVLNQLPKNSIIVDDNLAVIEEIAVKNNFFPIWINRKTGQKHPKVKTIHNLAEILKEI